MSRFTILTTVAFIFFCKENNAQLHIQPGAKLFLQGTAVVTVTGNLASGESMLGTGTLALSGTTLQQIQTASYSIPNLTIKNPANVKLSGDIRVNGTLHFVSGKIIADNYSVVLGENAVTAGASAGRFIETTGSGQLRKLANANISNYLLPLGSGNNYTPVTVSTSGSYSAAHISARTIAAVHPNKPAAVNNYLNTYWNVSQSGISGSITATATYTAANIIGNETTYHGFYWNGVNWTETGVTINTASNQVTAPVTGSGGDIYAMNDFATASAAQLEAVTANNLYPNPTASQSTITFTVDNAGPISISVYDVHGKLMQQINKNVQPGYHQYTVDLSACKPGVYEIRLSSRSFNKNYKLIKQ